VVHKFRREDFPAFGIYIYRGDLAPAPLRSACCRIVQIDPSRGAVDLVGHANYGSRGRCVDDKSVSVDFGVFLRNRYSFRQVRQELLEFLQE
jgi:hypothetical protein